MNFCYDFRIYYMEAFSKKTAKAVTALDVWHEQLKIGKNGEWDKLPNNLSQDCIWTLLTQGVSFRGLAEISEFIKSGYTAGAARDKSEVRCELTVGDWAVYEYTSRGIVDSEKITQFVKNLSKGLPIKGLLSWVAKWRYGGKKFEVSVCFVVHINKEGFIDIVNEYVGKMVISA